MEGQRRRRSMSELTQLRILSCSCPVSACSCHQRSRPHKEDTVPANAAASSCSCCTRPRATWNLFATSEILRSSSRSRRMRAEKKRE
eukprot:753857-Hanusia_phi.AAC.1